MDELEFALEQMDAAFEGLFFNKKKKTDKKDIPKELEEKLSVEFKMKVEKMTPSEKKKLMTFCKQFAADNLHKQFNFYTENKFDSLYKKATGVNFTKDSLEEPDELVDSEYNIIDENDYILKGYLEFKNENNDYNPHITMFFRLKDNILKKLIKYNEKLEESAYEKMGTSNVSSDEVYKSLGYTPETEFMFKDDFYEINIDYNIKTKEIIRCD